MARTKRDVTLAALDVLGEHGIDAVTVRAVADRLGVKAPALYWHVKNKQDLLDEMGTEVARRVQRRFAAPTGDWIADLQRLAHATRAEYVQHRDGARTFSGTRLTDPDVLRAREAWLADAVGQGLTVHQAATASSLVLAFVTGFVIEEQEWSDPSRYDLTERANWIGVAHPLVVEAGTTLAGDPDARFAEQLAVVVAGLTALFD